MDEPFISKSARKREAEALQQFGVQLIQLKLEKLRSLPLSDALLTAILDAKKLKSQGAIRRQAQLIGKLMRAADYEAIRQAYQMLHQ